MYRMTVYYLDGTSQEWCGTKMWCARNRAKLLRAGCSVSLVTYDAR